MDAPLAMLEDLGFEMGFGLGFGFVASRPCPAMEAPILEPLT